MNVEGTDHPLFGVHDQQAADLVDFHQLRRFDRERVGTNGFWRLRHHLGNAGGAQIHAGVIEGASQVAVGVQPEQAAIAIDHRGHAQALAAHLHQRFADGRVGADARYLATAVHDVGDVQQQPPAKGAGRMRAGEVLGGETARFQQCDRKCVAHRQRRGGAGGGRKVQRAGLGGHADVEVYVGFAREQGGRAPGHGDQLVALALQHRQQHQQFVAFAGVRQRQHHVRIGDHAQVAVAGFAGMHVERRGAGRCEGRGDLAGDMARLAHAGADHAAAGL